MTPSPPVRSSNKWAPSPSPPPSPDVASRERHRARTFSDSSSSSRRSSTSSRTTTKSSKQPKTAAPRQVPRDLPGLERAAAWHVDNGDGAGAAAYLNRIGLVHFRAGNNKKAVQAYQRAVAETVDYTQLAQAYTNMGTVYWSTGNAGSAVQVLQQALATYALVALPKAKEALAVAGVQHQLGLAFAMQGNYAAAIDSLRAAGVAKERLTGLKSVTTARTVDALGLVYRRCGDFARALECHEQAFGILRSHGADCLETLDNLSQVHLARRDNASALHVLMELLREKKMLLAKSQTTAAANNVAETLQTMASIYQHAGQEDVAAHCQKEISDIFALAALGDSSSSCRS